MTYVDTAASYLFWQANDATWDMYHNYVNAPGYRSTYREMFKLLQTVKTISAAIRDEDVGAVGPAFPIAIAQDMQEANGMLQALRQDVAKWQIAANNAGDSSRLSIGAKLDQMSETLHQLMGTLGLPANPNMFAPRAFAPNTNGTQPTPTDPVGTPGVQGGQQAPAVPPEQRQPLSQPQVYQPQPMPQAQPQPVPPGA
ncbi:MAG: hypothetical protein ACK5Q5_24750 [Planctomycetaceae bacterium]